MLDALVTLIVDESKWLTVSMGLALSAATALWYRFRDTEVTGRRVVLAAMCLFFGVMVGTMAFGHLLAVTCPSPHRPFSTSPTTSTIGAGWDGPLWERRSRST